MSKAKLFVAEFVGTFTLVFVSAAAALYYKVMGILGIALAYGLMLAVLVYLYGRISGAHFNPAVTLGLAANGNMRWGDAALYWLAQFLGGIVAALVLHTFFGALSSEGFSLAMSVGLMTIEHPYLAVLFEALLTFFLVTTFLHSMVDGKPVRPSAGWAIGATLVVAVLAGYPFTGASLNPARSFGLALFTSSITAGKPDYLNTGLYLIYFMGPLIGAVLAALLYRFFQAGSTLRNEVQDAEVVEIVEETISENPAPRPALRRARRK